MGTNRLAAGAGNVISLVGLGLLISALLAPSAAGQQRLTIEGHGGVAVPTGRLADLTDAGPTVGVEMSYPMNPRTSVKVRGDLDELGGARLGAIRAPDMHMWRYGVGVERILTGSAGVTRARRPDSSRWSLVGDVGLGATSLDTESFAASGGATRDLTKTYVETNAGLRVNFEPAPRVRVYAGARGSLTFANTDDTQILASLDPQARTRAFGSSLTVPVIAGLSIRL